MPADKTALAPVRRALAALEKGPVLPATGGGRFFRLGADPADMALGKGLSRGALHEVLGPEPADAAAAAGFGLGLTLRAAGEGPLVWVRHDFIDAEAGGLDGMGLAEFGADPARLIVVRVRTPADTLRAASEALRCKAVGATLVEVWGDPKALDFTATRRLALGAAATGVTLVLVRLASRKAEGVAQTRWQVAGSPSASPGANAPGNPAFAVTLVKNKNGNAGQSWIMEWQRERQGFAERAPLSGAVLPIPADRPAATGSEAGYAAEKRRTG